MDIYTEHQLRFFSTDIGYEHVSGIHIEFLIRTYEY